MYIVSFAVTTSMLCNSLRFFSANIITHDELKIAIHISLYYSRYVNMNTINKATMQENSVKLHIFYILSIISLLLHDLKTEKKCIQYKNDIIITAIGRLFMKNQISIVARNLLDL